MSTNYPTDDPRVVDEEVMAAPGSPVFLLIEDDRAQMDVLQEILGREGHTFESATTCAEGHSIFEPGRFSVALIDLGLPDGSGMDLIADFAQQDSNLVPIVMTGDGATETVIDTMRSGAFDYLVKPVSLTALQAAIERALAHHAVAAERDRLFALLVEEREQLRARVEAATADIRQSAAETEASNARLRSLLHITQLSNTYYNARTLLTRVFEELGVHLPLRCVTLCDVPRAKIAAAYGPHPTSIEFVATDGDEATTVLDPVLMESQPAEALSGWIADNVDLNTDKLKPVVYPQFFGTQANCVVAFFLEESAPDDSHLREYLDMSAYFIAFEWERSQLLYHAAHHASLGNIAVELARNFAQPLTAIQTAADFVREDAQSEDASEGLAIISENVDKLRRQTQEFRKLDLDRQDSVETIHLDVYVNQALELLSVAIQNRDVTVVREFAPNCECVLLNGAALSRSLLDVILVAVRDIDAGGRLLLNLSPVGSDHVELQVRYQAPLDDHLAHMQVRNGSGKRDGDAPVPNGHHPVLQLVERAIHRCSGTLKMNHDQAGEVSIRLVLPRNAASPAATEAAL